MTHTTSTTTLTTSSHTTIHSGDVPYIFIRNNGNDIFRACELGYNKTVKYILDNVEDPITMLYSTDINGYTLLQHSINHLDVIKTLVNTITELQGKSSAVEYINRTINRYKLNILMEVLIKKRPLETIQYLVKSGIDINAVNDMGNTALMYACYYDILDTGTLANMIDKYSDCETIEDQLLYNSATKYLIDNGANVNMMNIRGETAYTVACSNIVPMSVIKYIIDATNINDMTANMIAYTFKHLQGMEIFDYLVHRGLNVFKFEERNPHTNIFTEACIIDSFGPLAKRCLGKYRGSFIPLDHISSSIKISHKVGYLDCHGKGECLKQCICKCHDKQGNMWLVCKCGHRQHCGWCNTTPFKCCAPRECRNFKYCNVKLPQYLFESNHGMCVECISQMGEHTMTIVMDECSVCLENKYMIKLMCDHMLCNECWYIITRDALASNVYAKCPLCRHVNSWK